MRMRFSTVTGNATGLLANGGGQLISQGGNTVAGNTTNGAFSSSPNRCNSKRRAIDKAPR